MSPLRESTPGPCPSEDQLLAHAQGAASPQDLEGLLRHLDRCATCRYLLAESSRSVPTPTPKAPVYTFQPGDMVLDRYRIERCLGQSTRGEVYLARDQLLVEAVALKTLTSAALDDPLAAFRFRAEARLARKVTHPNVCRILEFGLYLRRQPRAESVPFLTMEFLTGETVKSRIERRGALPEAEAVPLFAQVLAGLQAIHLGGIVHGDFRSENVFLVRQPRGERALGTDFAPAHPGPLLDGAVETMPPEQIEGRSSEPTIDVFACGVFLFEVLTGRRPFLNVPVIDRLGARAPLVSTLAANLSPGWDPLVARCLDPNPASRYPSLAELGIALADVVRPLKIGRRRSDSG